jgi:hypothetical protein
MLETITPPIDVPRANLDPITTLSEKLAVFSLALMRPLRHETIVLCCDSSQRGVGIFAFDTKLKLTKIIDRIIGSAIKIESVETISLCSSRAGDSQLVTDKSQFSAAKNRCQNAGISLVDWFIVAKGDVHCLN